MKKLNVLASRISHDHGIYAREWWEEKFQTLFQESKPNSALPVECFSTLYNCVLHCNNIPGVCIECGVDRGGSAHMIGHAMIGKELHLFDTFEGMPKTSDIDYHEEGDFPPIGLENVARNVACSATYHKGMIPETFNGVELEIAFAHIDLDVYQSTKDCIAWVYPRVSRGGIMLFDDYGRVTCPGVPIALNEFFNDKPERLITNWCTGQALAIKL